MGPCTDAETFWVKVAELFSWGLAGGPACDSKPRLATLSTSSDMGALPLPERGGAIVLVPSSVEQELSSTRLIFILTNGELLRGREHKYSRVANSWHVPISWRSSVHRGHSFPGRLTEPAPGRPAYGLLGHHYRPRVAFAMSQRQKEITVKRETVKQ